MRRKDRNIFFLALCFFGILLLCPTAVFAKSAPKKLVLNYKSLTLYVGETESLQVSSVKPKKASRQVIWKSKKPGIAAVSDKGWVLAKKAGKTEITAVSGKNPKVTKSILITVRKRPQKIEKEFTVNGDIYDLFADGNMRKFRNALYELDSYQKKGYAVIPSKEAFLKLAGDVKSFSQFEKTDFKKERLVLVKCLLYRTYNERVTGFRTELDASGRLRGLVSVQYNEREEEPDTAYPAVMDDYVVILRVPKKDAARIDYFQCRLSN